MTDFPALAVSPLWPQLVALYCAALLPLPVGLPPIIAITESVYVMTGREIWKQAARFWGKLFGIVLLMWTIGSIALAILYIIDSTRMGSRIRGMPGPAAVAFVLPLLLAGGWLLWTGFRSWWGPHRVRHLLVTWSWVPLSALAILVAAIGYGFLDNPDGTELDPGSVRIWIQDLPAVLLNPAAQSRFVHLMGASYLTAATLVLSVSAWYLLRDRNVRIARRSMTVAASFGFAAALSLAVLGDRAGYGASPGQQMRIAAIAAEWHTQAAPASFTILGLPDSDSRTTRFAVDVPWALGLAATHSWRKSVAGLDDLETLAASRIQAGIAASTVFDSPRGGAAVADDRVFDLEDNPDWGYALLLLRETRHPPSASRGQIAAAARSTIPNVPLLFWAFRAMAVLGLYGIVLFGCAFWLASKRRLEKRGFLRLATWSLPVPWVAGALGWVVSEAGRGPWLVDGLLPITQTHFGRPDATVGAIACLAIAAFFAAGAALLVRLVRLGPEGLKFWPMDPAQAGKY
jgi:cytochrome d ubiquinol oxidase subunit I